MRIFIAFAVAAMLVGCSQLDPRSMQTISMEARAGAAASTLHVTAPSGFFTGKEITLCAADGQTTTTQHLADNTTDARMFWGGAIGAVVGAVGAWFGRGILK